MDDDISSILVDEASIQGRIKEIGAEISERYRGKELLLIWIQSGALLFTADLIRSISIPVKIDSIRVSSYKGTTRPVSEPLITQRPSHDLEGENVVLIDDIFDTGKTLERVISELKKMNPGSIESCVLIEKQANRQTINPCNYVGFNIQDQFVVGYGLDFAEKYRNLPYIGVLKPEFQNPPEWV